VGLARDVRGDRGLLLGALAAALTLLWLAAESAAATAVLVFVVGVLGFAVIPGMQAASWRRRTRPRRW
jgi:DHA1 family inner membrane transport protein